MIYLKKGNKANNNICYLQMILKYYQKILIIFVLFSSLTDIFLFQYVLYIYYAVQYLEINDMLPGCHSVICFVRLILNCIQ